MRSYPIWVVSYSDALYKSSKNLGAHNCVRFSISVGTSKSNSHEFAHVEVKRKSERGFELWLDGVKVKAVEFDSDWNTTKTLKLEVQNDVN